MRRHGNYLCGVAEIPVVRLLAADDADDEEDEEDEDEEGRHDDEEGEDEEERKRRLGQVLSVNAYKGNERE